MNTDKIDLACTPSSKTFSFIDLFAGIGGFRIALESLGGHCVFSSEWDKYAQKTYEANFNELPHGDITKIDAKEIPNHDVLCAGFPCQAFSINGKQRGFKDTRGTLFYDIARIINFHNPKIVFLENVRNFVNHNNKKTLKRVSNILKNLGYTTFYKVLNSSYYGCPTKRERFYLVGIKRGLNPKFSFPAPTNKKIFLEDVLEKNPDKKYLITRADVFFNENLNSYKEILRPIRIGRFGKGRQGERIYSPKGHAITLSSQGGGTGAKTGAYLTKNGIRKLTPRECARVMGFADSYIIPVTDAQAYKQFGNSVTVPVIVAIAQKFKDFL